MNNLQYALWEAGLVDKGKVEKYNKKQEQIRARKERHKRVKENKKNKKDRGDVEPQV
jgi:hypothetical protein